VSRRIARPYATALFQVMRDEGVTGLRHVEAQLATAAALFASRPDLLRAFEVPAVAPAKKRELLEAIGRTLDLARPARRMLAVLEQHYRLRYLGEVVTTLSGQIDALEGKVRGKVTVPGAPEAGQVDRLAALLADALGQRVELESEVDPALLAGFVVRLGSRVFDGSLRTQLRRFAETAGSR
jgi:F-type H+-transporting ATPase subunit delta